MNAMAFEELYQQQSSRNFDETLIEEASWDDLDQKAIKAYRKLREEVRQLAPELQFDDEGLLLSIGAVVKMRKGFVPTVAGLVLFGKESLLEHLFPMAMRIDYITVERRQRIPDPEKCCKGIEFRGSLILAFPRILDVIMRDIPEAFIMLPGEIYRRDIPIVPRIVVREALCNAIMHCDYRVNKTIQILRYPNRIEFRNAGSSLKSEDQLGFPGPTTRNKCIARVMQDLNLAEIKGSGVGKMREEMKKVNLSIPLLVSDEAANSFSLTLFTHRFFNEDDIKWLEKFKVHNISDDEARAFIVAREMRGITNADYRSINAVDALSADFHLKRLRALDLLEQQGVGETACYIPTEKLLYPNG